MHRASIKLNRAAGCGMFHGFGERCRCPRPWRIIKTMYDPAYPWLVSRFTGDYRYEPVMRCATYDKAAGLVQALVWLATFDNAASSILRKGNPYVE